MNCCKIIDKNFANSLLPKRIAESNKGTYGKVLNFSGCKDYIGAAYLSSKSALKVGAGLVELATPSYVKDKVSCLCPELIYSEISSFAYLENIPQNIDLSKYNVLLVGCGLNNNKYTKKFINNFIEQTKDLNYPIIYDADALNIIAETEITNIGKNTILTPHPAELSRLLKTSIQKIQDEREKYALEAAKKYNSTVILKGNNTIIANNVGEIYKDTKGTNALAKAGTGDVLAGIIAGLCSQGANALNASISGVFVHSLAGLEAEKELTQYAVLASELIDYIPKSIKIIIS